jgi:hypothetical protein
MASAPLRVRGLAAVRRLLRASQALESRPSSDSSLLLQSQNDVLRRREWHAGLRRTLREQMGAVEDGTGDGEDAISAAEAGARILEGVAALPESVRGPMLDPFRRQEG